MKVALWLEANTGPLAADSNKDAFKLVVEVNKVGEEVELDVCVESLVVSACRVSTVV